jgi:PmbA protein
MAGARLTLAEARVWLELARQAAAAIEPGAEIEVTAEGGDSELTRFANNGIHQNVAESSLVVSVRAQVGRRTARASTHRLDAAGVRAATARAIGLARAQAEDADLLPMAEAEPVTAVNRWDEATAAITPAMRAAAAGAMVEESKRAGLTAAGICATHRSAVAVANSRGLEAYYAATGAEYSVTALGDTSSGWAKASSPRWADLDAKAGAQIAVRKALASARPREITPGKYTVILEPAAVLDLIGFLVWDFGGLPVMDQRSFLSDRVGKKIFGDNITIHDDVFHFLQTGMPFDGEGVPRRRLTLVERGWVKNLVYARQSAARWNREHPAGERATATGHGFALPNEYGEAPVNVVIAGGEMPVERQIAETERGILVTRLWYIREVDPYQKILTGMTRDGTFLIENGKLAGGVRNLRFNQSMVEMLNQVEALGPAVRASGEESFDMVAPAMKVRGFNFTEVTRF